MPKVSAAFFAVGVLCALIGMLAGMHMGASADMRLMPAHAHLNLLGWVTMALYGTFYALTRDTYSPRLAWANFIVATLSILVLLPALSLFLLNANDPKYVPVMITGEVLTVLGMVIFAISVVRELARKRVAA